MPLVLLGLAIVVYYALSGNASAAPTIKSNVVSVVMSSPVKLSGDDQMSVLAASFGWDPKRMADAILKSPAPGQLIFSAAFYGDMPRLPAVGQSFVVSGVPVKIIAVSVAPARVGA